MSINLTTACTDTLLPLPLPPPLPLLTHFHHQEPQQQQEHVGGGRVRRGMQLYAVSIQTGGGWEGRAHRQWWRWRRQRWRRERKGVGVCYDDI